jgi:hypothetical protein
MPPLWEDRQRQLGPALAQPGNVPKPFDNARASTCAPAHVDTAAIQEAMVLAQLRARVQVQSRAVHAQMHAAQMVGHQQTIVQQQQQHSAPTQHSTLQQQALQPQVQLQPQTQPSSSGFQGTPYSHRSWALQNTSSGAQQASAVALVQAQQAVAKAQAEMRARVLQHAQHIALVQAQQAIAKAQADMRAQALQQAQQVQRVQQAQHTALTNAGDLMPDRRYATFSDSCSCSSVGSSSYRHVNVVASRLEGSEQVGRVCLADAWVG